MMRGTRRGTVDMAGYIIGGSAMLVGILLVTGALPFVHHAARLWPRMHTRGSSDLLGSTNFLARFIGLSLSLAGFGVILFEIVRV